MTIIHCEKCGWKGEDACPDCHQELPRAAAVLIPTCKDCGKMLVGTFQHCIPHSVGGDGGISAEAPSYVTSWLCPDTMSTMDPVWIRVEGRRFTPGQAAQEPRSPG